MTTLYRNYRFEDFARDERFREWVLDNDPESTRFWNEWMLQNPDCAEHVRLAKAFLLALEDRDPSLESDELDFITQRIVAAPVAESIFFWKNNAFRLAASILLVIGVGFGMYTYFNGVVSPLTQIDESFTLPLTDHYLESTNQTALPQQIALEDGSTVTLYPKSSIRYPNPFSPSRREVYLNGKAFFDITKNPRKPFWVYTYHISTQVLGTSFMVNSFADAKEANVEVKTGKVSVYTRKDLEKAKGTQQNARAGVVLTPNQQVAFSKTEERLLKSIVEAPSVVIEAPKQEFIFEEAPVSQVFRFLEKIYGLTVIYDAKTMEACYLTANLSDESLFDKLDLICKITHSGYEMVDGQIIIHSRGCK
ncbi:FecR family protein [Runella slithyformis]|uniref:Anti-FecI sigma factor, FecR n=1 Tax=Runella slithyformis (strain ATCC 29530 / DSM 19594 / LMG 11500 / NCIMB 11436 / LSU 4) TaxID=761193 RepID=A0A7U4E434_RUNSL|nr:FecR family protein [Runella slithyformis]AEI46869.1 anti-FecI sigma factor, FecR [Runella slithyformis DSM 19594]